MAVTKIHPIKTTLNKALDYICNPDKTDNQILISSYGCSYQTADIEFGFTLSKARDKGDNLGHHLIQSFAPGEVSYEEAHRIGKELAVKKLLLPSDLAIQSYDIAVILGNALDNAMEACRKLKEKEPKAKTFIRLSSVRKDKLLIFKIENSFDGTLKRKRQTGLPETDKADKKVHGIGLANIKNTAEKYQGTMDYKTDGRVFVLSVMIKNERGIEK